MGFRMQDFTCDETKAKYLNSPHHPQHPPVHPPGPLLLPPPPVSPLLLLLLGTDAPSPSAERMSAPWLLSSHSGAQSCAEDSRETLWAAPRSGTGCAAFSFSNRNLGIPVNYNKKRKRKKKRRKKKTGKKKKSRETCEGRRTTCRVSMASLMNSACLLFLPVALLLGEYPRQKINKNWYDSIETLNHQQCTTSTAAARASGVVLAARRCA